MACQFIVGMKEDLVPGTMVKMATQPKMYVLLDFLSEIDIRQQDKMIACSFEIIS